MTETEQRSAQVEYWGSVERFVLVFTVMTLAVLQILLLGEVFTDAGAEFVAATKAVYGIFGVIFAYLIMTIFGDTVEKMLVWAEGGITETQSEVISSLVWGGASVFVFSSLWKNEPATGEFAELAMTPDVFAVLLATVLAIRAVPRVVWKRLYGWLPHRASPDRAQADTFPMWVPAVIAAFIVVTILLNWAGVLPP